MMLVSGDSPYGDYRVTRNTWEGRHKIASVIGILVLYTLAVAGCGRQDPAMSFRQLINEAGAGTIVKKGRVDYKVIPGSVSYDVESTNSLVSPYKATVAVDVSCTLFDSDGRPDPNFSETQQWKIHYAYQDRQWVQKAHEVRIPPRISVFKVAGNDYVPTMQEVIATVMRR
jgi:hypothetical protein